MSTTVDEKVVEMSFKDNGFVTGVSKIIDAVTKLKAGLNLGGAAESLNELDAAGKKFSLSGIGNGIENVGSKFTSMGLIGIGVLTNLANKAIDAGLSIVKSLTIAPITAGLDVYETKINSIQTILANTQAAGTTLPQVTAALAELNTYANKTVFSFADMTKNIGTFTAAGVGLNASVSSIKGIANLAALSGASADQASNAMYQLSQAIAAGSVKLQDWNSVVNAGLGGKTFQTALENTARATGTNIDAIIKKAGSFRNSLQQGWLTSNILEKTLSQFTGDLSLQQIKAMGFTEQQAEQILKLGKTAVASATNIRTITQLMAALHEEVATAWSTVWETLIGNIGDATVLLTNVHNILETTFTKPIYDLNNFLKLWSQLGGRDQAILDIKLAFIDLEAILKPIGDAFNAVFTGPSAQGIVDFEDNLGILLGKLKLSSTGAAELKSTFEGIFSVLKIGVDVVEAVAKGIAVMFGAATGDAGGLLKLTSNAGDFVTHIKNLIESGNSLNTFFIKLGSILAVPINALSHISDIFGILGSAAQKAYEFIQPALDKIATAFKSLSGAIAKSLSDGSFADVEHAINEGLLGTVLLAVRKFISNLGKGEGSGGGFLDSIKESFEGLTGALKAMQTNLKSGTLEKIAIAVALLTASIVALSLINIANLTKSLTAITVMFTQLLLSLAVISKISGATGIVKLPIIAASLVIFATAILILAGAVAILSQFSWEELGKGIGAIAGLLTLLVGAIVLLSKNTAGVGASALAMEAMATAMNIMAVAVGKLGAMDWETLAKGVGTIAALLLIIAGFNAISGDGAGLIGTAAAMVIVGAAIIILANAVQILGSMPLEELGKGLGAIALALGIIAGGLALMQASLPGAAALLVASAAIIILSEALTTLGGLSWQELAVALVALAGSLVIIAGALLLMEASLPGAAALIVAAGALAILAPVLVVLGALSWDAIGKGLAVLAGALAIIGIAGLLLIPALPGLLGLGAAIALIGIGILAAGAGIVLFSAGIAALAIAIAALGVAITSFVTTVLGILPSLPAAFTGVITSFANGIAKAGPAILNALQVLLAALLQLIIKDTPGLVKAFETILDGIIELLTKDAPKIVAAVLTLLINMLNTLASKVPAFVSAAVNIVLALLAGIAANAAKVVAAAANIAVQFIIAIGAAGLRITAAGALMIINFINGLASQINKDTPQMRSAGINLALAIINGMTFGIAGGIPSVISAAENMASSALSAAKKLLGINSPSKEFQYVGESMPEGTIVGINNGIPDVEDAAANMGTRAVTAIQKSLVDINDAVNSNIDLQPRITPVLDLSQAQDGFSTLASMSKSQLISADTSLVKATSISANNATTASEIGTSTDSASSLTFNQYNTSPTALSTADIYRQTRNQLSVVKEALPKL